MTVFKGFGVTVLPLLEQAYSFACDHSHLWRWAIYMLKPVSKRIGQPVLTPI